MKYIILPILKFIWALILTLLYSIKVIITYLPSIIWDPKFKYNWLYTIIACKLDFIISPYWRPNDDYNDTIYNFKSYYHYIWNIK